MEEEKETTVRCLRCRQRFAVELNVNKAKCPHCGVEWKISWPWPREMYAYLIDYLQAGKAAACFIDIAMTE